MPNAPVTIAIVGAGHRALAYAEHAEHFPDEMKVVAVADPIERRRRRAAEKFDLPESACFESAEQLAAAGRIADAVINGTMDHQHVPTSLPLLDAGYDMLLEKPFATNEAEMRDLARAALGRKVMICHVLRYAPFYAALRRKVLDGAIGEIMNIQTAEHVSYHHYAVSHVRGKWNRKDKCHSSALMAKCCHDLDILAWMKSGISPTHVSSSGSLMYFRPEKAPAEAGTRCLVDCPIEPDCLYSARKHYLDHPKRWSFYVWAGLEHIDEPTDAQREEYLREESPFGRCVWKCDNDVVDNQVVCVGFADGSTATHSLVGGTPKPMRKIHILGTEGELQGEMDENAFVIRHIDPRPGRQCGEERVDTSNFGDTTGAFGGHGGGDQRLVADFVRFLRDEPRSISCTTIEDSIHGHQIGFAADRAMEEKTVVVSGNRGG